MKVDIRNKRVLIINTIGFQYEGITSVIMNYISNMSLSGISIDCVIYNHTNTELKEELEKLARPIELTFRKDNIKKYVSDLNKLMKENKYDTVHIHGNSSTMSIEAALARHNRVSNILVHCHNTRTDHPILNVLLKPLLFLCATDLIACSSGAGGWLYGRKKYILLNNAINLETFAFNEEVRKQVRHKLGLKTEIVIGHSGGFIQQKNHDFLIDVYKEYHDRNNNSKLLLLSDGPKFQEIKDKVHILGLDDSVIFLGRRSDANLLYNAMDVFILPSLWEGLPLVMLEAQANGLPVIAASTITTDAKCCKNIVYLELNNAKDWADAVAAMEGKIADRSCSKAKVLTKCGFNIKVEADRLRTIYMR